MTDFQHIEVVISTDRGHYASYTVTRQDDEGIAKVTYQDNEHRPDARRLSIDSPSKPCDPFSMALAQGVKLWETLHAEAERELLPVADDGSVA